MPDGAPGKPSWVFDREFEWLALTSFAGSPSPRARLGIVSGRRRQGKTYLLRALAEATGAFYYAAAEATTADSLRDLGAALAAHTGAALPYAIRDWETSSEQTVTSDKSERNGVLSGTPISVGTVVGPVRLIRSVADWSRVMPGEILVVSVIDPGLAPLFGLAGGLIAEMGGTLSHGAIIAREYGLPTIANVEGAMARLADGQRITIDAGSGTVCIESSPQP